MQIAQDQIRKPTGFEKIVAQSEAMMNVFDRAQRAAQTQSTVLIVGESGTGKELIAEAIHQKSSRREGPFVPVNMAAIPDTLVESELFGHVRGAFTGATADRMGRFESADEGTLFIDEIGDFQLASQAKLLRVLENHSITPVGGNKDKKVNVRVVAATSRDLQEMLCEGTFREDLYYRLNVVTIQLPPLRERPQDIRLLVQTFLKELCARNHRPTLRIDLDLMEYLESFEWPGNVRQLRNCLESMIVMARGDVLTVHDIPTHLNGNESQSDNGIRVPLGTTLEDLERTAIKQSLKHFQGNRTRAAEALGISIRTLQRRLKVWGMDLNGGPGSQNFNGRKPR